MVITSKLILFLCACKMQCNAPLKYVDGKKWLLICNYNLHWENGVDGRYTIYIHIIWKSVVSQQVSTLYRNCLHIGTNKCCDFNFRWSIFVIKNIFTIIMLVAHAVDHNAFLPFNKTWRLSIKILNKTEWP